MEDFKMFTSKKKLVLLSTLITLLVSPYITYYKINCQELSSWELPLQGGTWRFCNFSTNSLSKETFEEAFNLKWFNWINPIVLIIFYSQKDNLANGGNCFGMCLANNHIYDLNNYSGPFVGRVQKPIWRNYSSRNHDIDRLINTYHWRQLSVGFIKKWLDRSIRTPRELYEQINRDTRNGRLGYITISNGLRGHVLIPYSASVNRIHVYDPNTPNNRENVELGGLRYFIQIRGEHEWSFQHGRETWTNRDGYLNYITFSWSNLYMKLPTNIVDIIVILCGKGVNVEQIEDEQGRRLFKKSNPTSLVDLDTSTNGLGRHIMRVIPYSQNLQNKTIQNIHLSKLTNDLQKTMQARYGIDYGSESEIYFVCNKNLKNLSIKAQPNSNKKDVVMAIGNGQQFFEIKMKSVIAAHNIHPEINIVDASNLNRGIKIRDRQNISSKAEISQGFVKLDKKELHIQKIKEIRFSKDPINVAITPAKEFSIKDKQGGRYISVFKELIDSRGNEKSLGSKKIMIQKISF